MKVSQKHLRIGQMGRLSAWTQVADKKKCRSKKRFQLGIYHRCSPEAPIEYLGPKVVDRDLLDRVVELDSGDFDLRLEVYLVDN